MYIYLDLQLRVYNVAALLWLQFTVRVMLFPAINLLTFYISKYLIITNLSAQCQNLILLFKHYISNIFPSFIVHHQGDQISVSTKYEVQLIYNIIQVLCSEADSLISV
jgi:hypothetical protein